MTDCKGHPPRKAVVEIYNSFGQFLAVCVTQPESSDMVTWSNIDGEGRVSGTNDIPSFVFVTASWESSATLPLVFLARIVWIQGFTLNNYYSSLFQWFLFPSSCLSFIHRPTRITSTEGECEDVNWLHFSFNIPITGLQHLIIDLLRERKSGA